MTFFQKPFSTPNYTALSAPSFYIIFHFFKISIFLIKNMSIFTMGLSGIKSRISFTSKCIYFCRNRFEMTGINASSIFTKMIYLQTPTNWSFKNLIRQSVSGFRSTFDFYSAVSLRRHTGPDPAPIFFYNFFKQPFLYFRHAVLTNTFTEWCQV